MNHEVITVLIVDDHFVVRSGLITTLKLDGGIKVVAEAESGEEALAAYRENRPSVVMMDLQLPGVNGISAIAALREFDATVRILVFSNFCRVAEIQAALAAGALGYLSKSARRESLLTALRSVAQGNRYLPDDVARQLNVARVGPTITAREREVLNGIAAGLPNKQIASALDISEFTVKRHVSQILYKMSVNDRAQAVVEAIRRGLVKSP